MNIYSPASLENIKGVGEVSLAKLRQAKFENEFDLINFLPRDYRAINFVPRIADIAPGEVTILARADKIKSHRTNRVTTYLTADLSDDTGTVQAVWFNQPYRSKQISLGQFYFTGKFDLSRGRYQLVNPSVKQANRQNASLSQDYLEPIYSQVRGLKSSFFSKIMATLKPDILTLNESLPQAVVDNFSLLPRSDAMYQLHFPSSPSELEKAQRRLQFETYFLASLASTLNGLRQRQVPAPKISSNVDLAQKFVSKLPFELTDDQRKAVWKIMQKISSGAGMNLLLQGDVGSGKTLVAEIISLLVAKSGFQVAILAPTETLARQHFQSFERDLSDFDLKISLLVGSSKDKKAIYQDLSEGKINIVVGTHALIQESLEFAKLGLVVIDEQHRFGVNQRQAIMDKAKIMPHLLAMTATPIPRSLMLAIQNEISVTSLRQKPAKRLPIKTEIFKTSKQNLVYERVIEELEQGRQAYVVCGLIDESDEEQRDSVETVYKTLRRGALRGYKLAILHGKMKPAEKDTVMSDFKARKIDVLISTTVIEVGVDVPNATVMVINDAENYGLSQLHQLRGRVGRGDLQSYCYLLTSLDSPNERLRAIEASQDGFYLSEVDLKLRGAGNLHGTAQHGWFNLELDTQAIEQAQEAVDFYLQDLKEKGRDIELELADWPELRERLTQFDRVTVLN